MSVFRSIVLKIVALVALLVVPASTALAQTHIRLPPLTADAISQIMQNYYRAPMPEHVATVIQSAMAQGLADNRAKRLTLIAFMAGLITDDVANIDRLAPVFEKLADNGSRNLIRAILYSGRPDWKEQIARLKTLWPDKAADIDALAARGARPVPTLQRSGQPEVIDMNWAYFGATGRREPVNAIIEALGDLQSSNPQLLAMAHHARLTLATQAIGHEVVYQICRRAQMGSYGNEVLAVIVASQSRDLAHFRADADASARAAAAATATDPKPATAAAVTTTRKP